MVQGCDPGNDTDCVTKRVTLRLRPMGRPRIHQSAAERTAAWRQRQRLATIGIGQPDADLAAENARLRGELERLVLDLAAARADVARLTQAAARPPTRPPAPRTPSPPASRPLPPPTPPLRSLPAPSAGPSAPVLNRAQRRQAEREQRRQIT